MGNRPQIKVPYTPIDIIVDLMSITLLIVICVYTASTYFELPETIPIHFNASGEPDNYGSKKFIFLVPFIAIMTFALIFTLNKYPHMHNYMVNITEENALKNYRFSTRVLRWVNFLCVLLSSYITYVIIQNAKGVKMGLGSGFLPIVIGFSILLPVVLFVCMKKLNKQDG